MEKLSRMLQHWLPSLRQVSVMPLVGHASPGAVSAVLRTTDISSYTRRSVQIPTSVAKSCRLAQYCSFIQDHPRMPRKELMERCFYRNSPPASMDTNQNQAFDFALSVLSMMPFAENELLSMIGQLVVQRLGRSIKSAYEAIEGAIAVGRSLSRDEKRMVSQSLSVAKLRSCGLDILKTDDFRQHLDYDPVIEGMYIFHHHGFLRGHLSSTRASVCPDNRSV